MPKKKSQATKDKTSNLVVRVTDEFRKKVEKAGEDLGLSTSEVMRKAVDLFIDLQQKNSSSDYRDVDLSLQAKEAMDFYNGIDPVTFAQFLEAEDFVQFSYAKQFEKVVLDHFALRKARMQVREETGLYGLTDTERTVPMGRNVELVRYAERMKLEYIAMLLEPVLRPPDLTQEEKTELKNQVKEVYRLARKTGRP